MVLVQERICGLATGTEVLAYEAVRRLAYTVAFRSACGDILSQAKVDSLFDDFQLLSEGSFAPVRPRDCCVQDGCCVLYARG